MDARQEAKANMYAAIIAFFAIKENEAIVATVPALGKAIALLVIKLAGIRANAAIQLDQQTGGAGKATSRADLNGITFSVSQAIFAYASSIGDVDLKQKSKYTKTDLKEIRDEDIKEVAENIHGLAENNISNLTDFGIAALILSTFQKLIENYTGKIASPALIKAAKKTAGTNIVALFKQGDDILKTQMDPLVNGLQTTQPTFVTNYYNVREIIDPAVRHTTIAGTITDAKNDNVPIAGATVILQPDNIKTTTDPNGKYKFEAKPKISYTVRVEKEFFIPQEKENQIVKLGTTLTVNFGLMPS